MSDILVRAERFLRDEVSPQAQLIDHNPAALSEVLNRMVHLELMSLRRPQEYGGPAVQEGDFRRFQSMIARYSGALAFLQTQHQSAVSMLAKSGNEDLKERKLRQAHLHEGLMAIGFSQLRRPGPPLLTATPTDGGFRINGHLPWVTGFGLFPNVLIGAELPSGEAIFGLIPFSYQVAADGGTISFSLPMKLAAMQSAQTVTGELSNWFLPENDVMAVHPRGWIHKNDMINIALQGFFAVGCAQAGIDVVAKAYEKRPVEFLKETIDALTAEVEECQEALGQAQSRGGEDTTQERLDLRAWAIELMVRCAHAGVTATSGAANTVENPAQRVYREALVFTVSAQTSAIMESTLRRLVRSTTLFGQPPIQSSVLRFTVNPSHESI